MTMYGPYKATKVHVGLARWLFRSLREVFEKSFWWCRKRENGIPFVGTTLNTCHKKKKTPGWEQNVQTLLCCSEGRVFTCSLPCGTACYKNMFKTYFLLLEDNSICFIRPICLHTVLWEFLCHENLVFLLISATGPSMCTGCIAILQNCPAALAWWWFCRLSTWFPSFVFFLEHPPITKTLLRGRKLCWSEKRDWNTKKP